MLHVFHASIHFDFTCSLHNNSLEGCTLKFNTQHSQVWNQLFILLCASIHCKLLFFFTWPGFTLVWPIFMPIIHWSIYICTSIAIVIGLANHKKHPGIFGLSFTKISINHVTLPDVFIKRTSLPMTSPVSFCHCKNQLFKINFILIPNSLGVYAADLEYKLCCWRCSLIVSYVAYVCFW